jgi:type II secretory pathway component PulJ
MTLIPPRKRQGSVLLEAMAALLVLALGVLALAHYQATLLALGTDAQVRAAANAHAQELLALLRADPTHASCYQVPPQGTCSQALAAAEAQAWRDRCALGLPALIDAGAQMPDAHRMVVTLRWRSKAFREPRTLAVTTDVRN